MFNCILYFCKDSINGKKGIHWAREGGGKQNYRMTYDVAYSSALQHPTPTIGPAQRLTPLNILIYIQLDII